MSEESREEVVRREFDRWNAGERREIDPQVLHHDVVVHSQMTNATYHGHDGVRRWMAEIDDQFDGWHSTIDEFRGCAGGAASGARSDPLPGPRQRRGVRPADGLASHICGGTR